MAGESLGRAVLELAADQTGLDGGLDTAEDKVRTAADLMNGLLAAVGVGFSLQAVIDATIQAEQSSMLLANAVRATGMAAGFSAQQLEAQSMVLQEATGISDEAIKDMQRTLMTFRNIHGDVFRDASRVVLDFAAATGRDAADSARTLGMALNDPVGGLSRLKMAGVAVTDTLRAQVEQLVANGDLVGAQTRIIKELESAYGGTAAAARDTLGGSLAALRERFGDLFLEQVAAGKQLREFIELVIQSLPAVAAVFTGVFAAVKHQIEGVTENLFFLGQGLFRLATGEFKLAMESFGELQNPIKLMASSVAEGTLAWEASTAAIHQADAANRLLAETAPINAGIVAQSAAQMMASMSAETDKFFADNEKRVEENRQAWDSYHEKKKATATKHLQDIQRIEQQQLRGASDFFGNLMIIMAAAFGEQSGAYKVFAISQATMQAFMAYSAALATPAPWPLPQIFAATAFAAGMANVAKIAAMEEGGRFFQGDTMLVGEAGPELIHAARGGVVTPNDELSGMGSGIEVNNNITVQGIDFSDLMSANRVLAGIAEAAKRGTQEAIAAGNSLADLTSLHLAEAV